eukprot:TRINITY_DN2584_c0_g1_i1.p1 TRINITY_DN2584_c0_g1~~TRINITY_DN2584_c0_g1_i1.p1  ORF type:complete len:682 (+),score=129.73 TRINITY_DN2584_c0_g1_i1:58-2103(+)
MQAQLKPPLDRFRREYVDSGYLDQVEAGVAVAFRNKYKNGNSRRHVYSPPGTPKVSAAWAESSDPTESARSGRQHTRAATNSSSGSGSGTPAGSQSQPEGHRYSSGSPPLPAVVELLARVSDLTTRNSQLQEEAREQRLMTSDLLRELPLHTQESQESLRVQLAAAEGQARTALMWSQRFHWNLLARYMDDTAPPESAAWCVDSRKETCNTTFLVLTPRDALPAPPERSLELESQLCQAKRVAEESQARLSTVSAEAAKLRMEVSRLETELQCSAVSRDPPRLPEATRHAAPKQKRQVTPRGPRSSPDPPHVRRELVGTPPLVCPSEPVASVWERAQRRALEDEEQRREAAENCSRGPSGRSVECGDRPVSVPSCRADSISSELPRRARSGSGGSSGLGSLPNGGCLLTPDKINASARNESPARLVRTDTTATQPVRAGVPLSISEHARELSRDQQKTLAVWRGAAERGEVPAEEDDGQRRRPGQRTRSLTQSKSSGKAPVPARVSTPTNSAWLSSPLRDARGGQGARDSRTSGHSRDRSHQSSRPSNSHGGPRWHPPPANGYSRQRQLSPSRPRPPTPVSRPAVPPLSVLRAHHPQQRSSAPLRSRPRVAERSGSVPAPRRRGLPSLRRSASAPSRYDAVKRYRPRCLDFDNLDRALQFGTACSPTAVKRGSRLALARRP